MSMTGMQRKRKSGMQMPDLSVSRANQERAQQLIDNFIKAAERQVSKNSKEFSTLAGIMRLVKKDKHDPSEKLALESVKRMEKDKIHSQVALQMSDMTMKQVQSMQQSMIIKMIPYLVGLLGILVLASLIAFARPFSFENPTIQRYLMLSALFIPMFIWGLIQRKKVQNNMLAVNIVFQASSAYASAKMQGKGSVGAMQNLAEMKRKAKSMEDKNKKQKKK